MHRLHQKLKVIKTTDAEGDVDVEEAALDEHADEGAENEMQGWWSCLGLLDHQDINPESLAALSGRMRGRTRNGELAVKDAVSEATEAPFAHLFPPS